MTVECPACKTIFPVDPRKVPVGGVHARCSSCSQVFFVEAPPSRAFPEAADAIPSTEAQASVQHEPPTDEWTSDVSESQDSASQNREPEFAYPEPVFTMDSPSLGGHPSEEVLLETAEEGPHSAPPGLDPSPGPLFGRRDPVEKAQRLARVLVSDIILYNPDRHRMALDGGRVREEFEEEIQKSWIEYVEQVGEEIAATTTFFDDALNEILVESDGTP